MKTSFITSLFLTLALAFTVSAQETLQVDVTKLDAQQLQVYQQLKQQQARAQAVNAVSLDNLTPEKIDKYGQMAKAFGVAVHEGLGAITKNADEFAQTGAGKMTIGLIAWKVMGQDAIGIVNKAIHYVIGVPLLFIFTVFFIVILRRQCFPRPNLVSATKVGWLTVKREYKGTNGPAWDGEAAAVCCLFYAISVAVCSLIIFVG
jgi:hypothetical protein